VTDSRDHAQLSSNYENCAAIFLLFDPSFFLLAPKTGNSVIVGETEKTRKSWQWHPKTDLEFSSFYLPFLLFKSFFFSLTRCSSYAYKCWCTQLHSTLLHHDCSLICVGRVIKARTLRPEARLQTRDCNTRITCKHDGVEWSAAKRFSYFFNSLAFSA
jgi:hypothetical protein